MARSSAVSSLLRNSIVRLLKKSPFYGHLALFCRKEEGSGDKPIGLTVRAGIPFIYVQNKLFSLFQPEEQDALVEHVLKHLLHLHLLRCGNRHRGDWDISCDLAVNDTLQHLPPDAVRPEYFHMPQGLSAEEYYTLLAQPFDLGNLSGSGIGKGGEDRGETTGAGFERDQSAQYDDHTLWDDAESTPLSLAEEMLRSQVRDAYRLCEGVVPADIRQLVTGFLSPSSLPWQQILRQFVATAGRLGRQSTWMREHRRFEHQTPGTRKRHRLNLLIGVDVSESTDTLELRELFAAELVRIARCGDARLTILYANSRIQHVRSFTGRNMTVDVYRGGGFTDLRPVFDYARTLQPRPAAVIYLTDGYGPAPEVMEFPTLWVMPAGGKRPAPWGVELTMPDPVERSFI